MNLNVWWNAKGKRNGSGSLIDKIIPKRDESVCFDMRRDVGGGGAGEGGMHTYNDIHTRRELGGRGEVYVRARKKVGERGEKDVLKKKTQTIFFSQFELIMATLLSLFLLPILCIDKLSNPIRSLLIIFSSLSRFLLTATWQSLGIRDRKASKTRLNTQTLPVSNRIWYFSIAKHSFKDSQRQAQQKTSPRLTPTNAIGFQYSQKTHLKCSGHGSNTGSQHAKRVPR